MLAHGMRTLVPIPNDVSPSRITSICRHVNILNFLTIVFNPATGQELVYGDGMYKLMRMYAVITDASV